MRVGLTGGIGCGKSTVVRLLRERGAATMQTDAVAHDILREDKDVHAALRDRFGEGVFGADGLPDRQALAEQVFSREEGRAFLEALLHPRVRERWHCFLDEQGDGVAVVEIPLLFEKRLEKAFDLNVCVEADDAVATERLLARGLSEAQVLARRAAQLPLAEKVARADVVVSNSGSLAFLSRQIDTLFASFLSS